MTQSLLLGLKKRQTRHEERSLVIPNERRTSVPLDGITLYGVFSNLTHRAKSHFSLNCVIIRLCRATTQHSFCLAQQKMGLGSNDWVIENAP